MRPPEPVVVTPAVLRDWPLPSTQGDKNTSGQVLVVGGSDQTPGAVLLAAEAALRCGAGKLQIATVERTATAIAVAMPEALVRSLPTAPSGDISPDAAPELVEMAGTCAAVLVGPGVLDVETFSALLADLVPQLSTKLVMDAGALAYLSADHGRLGHLQGRAVLTPNPAELALTLGEDAEEVSQHMLAATTRLALGTGVVVSSGGKTSWTAHPDGRCWQDLSLIHI